MSRYFAVKRTQTQPISLNLHQLRNRVKGSMPDYFVMLNECAWIPISLIRFVGTAPQIREHANDFDISTHLSLHHSPSQLYR